MPSGSKALTPPLTGDQAKLISDVIDAAIRNYHGGADELEMAIGMYMVGRHVGWKPLVLIHSKRTIRKYEEILQINIREAFPEEGPDWDRSIGYSVAKRLSNFWKAVSGEEKIDGRRALE